MQDNNIILTQKTAKQLLEDFRSIVRQELQHHQKDDLESKEWLTTKETLSLLKVTGPTLWSYDKQGRTTPHYIGNRKRYRKSEILGILRKKELKRS